jgi:hypothetical protein
LRGGTRTDPGSWLAQTASPVARGKVSELSIQTLILNNHENIFNKPNEGIRVSTKKLEQNSQ